MSDEDRPIAWIDYIIASEDPADRALIEENHARTWGYGQLMQWITADPAHVTEESFQKMADEAALGDELQKRIHARAVELMESGAAPATVEQVAAWRAVWEPLAQNIFTEDTPVHRT